MKFHVLTLFPNMFSSPFAEGILARAIKENLLEIFVHNIRDYADGPHRTVDDYPFGGGPGMLMKPEPIFEAVDNHETPDIIRFITKDRKEGGFDAKINIMNYNG